MLSVPVLLLPVHPSPRLYELPSPRLYELDDATPICFQFRVTVLDGEHEARRALQLFQATYVTCMSRLRHMCTCAWHGATMHMCMSQLRHGTAWHGQAHDHAGT